MGQEISVSNIASISGLSVEEILDKMVEKKIGTSTGESFNNPNRLFDCKPIIGTILTIGNHKYQIVDNNTTPGVVVVRLYNERTTTISMNGPTVTTYNSAVTTLCDSWYQQEVPDDIKSTGMLINGENGQFVWVPTPWQVCSAVDKINISNNEIYTGDKCLNGYKTPAGRAWHGGNNPSNWETYGDVSTSRTISVLSTGAVNISMPNNISGSHTVALHMNISEAAFA